MDSKTALTRKEVESILASFDTSKMSAEEIIVGLADLAYGWSLKSEAMVSKDSYHLTLTQDDGSQESEIVRSILSLGGHSFIEDFTYPLSKFCNPHLGESWDSGKSPKTQGYLVAMGDLVARMEERVGMVSG